MRRPAAAAPDPRGPYPVRAGDVAGYRITAIRYGCVLREVADAARVAAMTLQQTREGASTSSVRSAAGPRRAVPLPWWLRLGTEEAPGSYRCEDAGCDAARVAASDLYCRSHSNFLLFRRRTRRHGFWNPVGLLPRVLVAALLWAAQFGSPLPLHGLFFFLGAVLILAPLRRWQVARRTALGCWAVTCAAVVVVPLLTAWGREVSALVLLGALSLALLVRCGDEAVRGSAAAEARARAERRAREARLPAPGLAYGFRAGGLVAATLAPLPAAAFFGAGLWLIPVEVTAVVPVDLQPWLLGLAVGTVAGAVLTAVLAGAFQGVGRINRRASPLLPAVPRSPRIAWARPVGPLVAQDSPDILGRIAAIFERTARQAVDAALRSLALAVNIVLAAGHLMLSAARAVLNWCWYQGVLMQRRVTVTIVRGGHTLRDALPIARAAHGLAARVIVCTLLGLIATAIGIVGLTEVTGDYLGSGRAVLLLPLLGFLVLALVGVHLAWLGLAGQSTTTSLESAGHNVQLLLPATLATAVPASWAVTAPSWFGVGTVRPGWLTLGLTTIPVGLAVIRLVRRRKR